MCIDYYFLFSFYLPLFKKKIAKTAVYSWWSTLSANNSSNKNNLDIDKNSTTTASDLNLSTRNETDSSIAKSLNSTISGLKLSNSFTSFNLSSLMKSPEDSVNNKTSKNKTTKVESV